MIILELLRGVIVKKRAFILFMMVLAILIVLVSCSLQKSGKSIDVGPGPTHPSGDSPAPIGVGIPIDNLLPPLLLALALSIVSVFPIALRRLQLA